MAQITFKQEPVTLLGAQEEGKTGMSVSLLNT